MQRLAIGGRDRPHPRSRVARRLRQHRRDAVGRRQGRPVPRERRSSPHARDRRRTDRVHARGASDRTASPGCARCRSSGRRTTWRSFTASPDDAWSITPAEASDEDMSRTYGPLASRRVVYGHIHRPFVRQLPGFVLGNSGCLSLSYDGDPRASYTLVDQGAIQIRRVEYRHRTRSERARHHGVPIRCVDG